MTGADGAPLDRSGADRALPVAGASSSGAPAPVEPVEPVEVVEAMTEEAFARAAEAVQRRRADRDDPVPMKPKTVFAGLVGADAYSVQMRVRFGPEAAQREGDGTVVDPETGVPMLELTVADTPESWARMARSLRAVRAARMVAHGVDIFVSLVGESAPAGDRERIQQRWRDLHARLVEIFPSAAASEVGPAGTELTMTGLTAYTSAGVLQSQAMLALALMLAVQRRAADSGVPGPRGLISELFTSDEDRARVAELYHTLTDGRVD